MPQNGREAHHHAQCHADRRPLVGAGDGAAVQPAGRPEPRVLRHRHPRVLAAYRRMAGIQGTIIFSNRYFQLRCKGTTIFGINNTLTEKY